MNSNKNLRSYFANLLYSKMKKNKNIWLVTGDLGYKLWDNIRKDYPHRFINAGASEQAMMGIGIGLALEEKIPIVYSITPFLLYRPFETIRNYIDHEQIPVKLVGSGRNRDYRDEGISHWAEEDKKVMGIFKNIESYWQEKTEELPKLFHDMIRSNKPWYVNLKK